MYRIQTAEELTYIPGYVRRKKPPPPSYSSIPIILSKYEFKSNYRGAAAVGNKMFFGPHHGGNVGILDTDTGRNLHSSTCWLNLSAFCGTGAACGGCLGGVQVMLGDIRGCLGFILCQKRLKLS